MNILFLMKPITSINPEKDTSLLFIQAAQSLGFNCFYLPQGNCNLTPTEPEFYCHQLHYNSQQKHHLDVNPAQLLPARDVDIIFIRTDPPFDNKYLLDMWVLEQCPKHIQLINSPAAIRTVNEKIWATQFKDLIPKTWVCQSVTQLKELLHEHKQLIIKPTDGFGGQGILKLSITDKNMPALLEIMTNNSTQYVIAQQYIPQATNGDKRILLWDGKPLGAVLRKHTNNDHRNNFFAGGTAHKACITTRDKIIISTLKPHLNSLGLRFVGLDIIGDYLIEINVTSPTCLKECNELDGKKHHLDILTSLTQSI